MVSIKHLRLPQLVILWDTTISVYLETTFCFHCLALNLPSFKHLGKVV